MKTFDEDSYQHEYVKSIFNRYQYEVKTTPRHLERKILLELKKNLDKESHHRKFWKFQIFLISVFIIVGIFVISYIGFSQYSKAKDSPITKIMDSLIPK